MIHGQFLITPLAADRKIAIGTSAVGVRGRLLGTLVWVEIMDPERPFSDLVTEVKRRILALEVNCGSK